MKRNPFRAVRKFVHTAAVVVALVVSALAIWSGISWAIQTDPHILWQAPLVFVAFFGGVAIIGSACSAVAHLWRKAEWNWDRKEQS